MPSGVTDFLRNARYHMPKVRLPDSVAGAGLGALGGLATAGIRDWAGGEEAEEDKPSYLTHALGGAALGFGAGNLLGDRARRYISNNVPPFGYAGRLQDTAGMSAAQVAGLPDTQSLSHASFLKPRSWKHFYNTAIADRPSEVTKKFLRERGGGGLSDFGADARMELLRRHMNLPVQQDQALFQSLGKKPFTPTVESGGVAGDREHLELRPHTFDRYKDRGIGKYLDQLSEHYTEPDTVPEMQFVDEQQMPTGLPTTNPKQQAQQESLGPWSRMFARHGREYDKAGDAARVFDHWDFGLKPKENELLRQYMRRVFKGDKLDKLVSEAQRKAWDKAKTVDWFGSRAGRGGDDPSEMSHMTGLAKRWVLNNVLGTGGPVVDQRFDMSQPGSPRPLFSKQSEDARVFAVKMASCCCKVVTRQTRTVKMPSVAPKDNNTASTTDMAKSKDVKGATPVVV